MCECSLKDDEKDGESITYSTQFCIQDIQLLICEF